MKQQRVETEDENWVKSIKIESCEEPESIPSTKIKVLNIPNLIGFFLGNEQKIKEASKEALITKKYEKNPQNWKKYDQKRQSSNDETNM